MNDPRRRRQPGRLTAATLALTAVLAGQVAPWAHEIPADVTAHILVRPEPAGLRMIVRVPLAAMRDVDFPLTGAGFLVLDDIESLLRDAATLWVADNLTVYQGDTALPSPRVVETRLSLPSDRSLTTWPDALAHVTGSDLPADSQLIWNQALLDILLETPASPGGEVFSIRPELARLGLRVVTVLRFFMPDGTVRAFEYSGDPGLVRLDPSAIQAALRFIQLGFEHILSGVDHLLFLLCLVIPFRRLGQLVLIVTAFTIAHSVTMVAAALGVAPGQLWFPPLIETLIAASILYMALENIVGATSVTRRWAIAFGFGLVHGFGFSFALRESLQFAGDHLVASLVAFNVGVEIGQVLALLVLVPALGLLFRRAVAERIGTIVLSALVAHTAWHWMVERGVILGEYDLAADPAAWLYLLRTAIAVVAIRAVWWAIGVARKKKAGDGAGLLQER